MSEDWKDLTIRAVKVLHERHKCRRYSTFQRETTLRGIVKAFFLVGSTTANNLCVCAGVDPDTPCRRTPRQYS